VAGAPPCRRPMVLPMVAAAVELRLLGLSGAMVLADIGASGGGGSATGGRQVVSQGRC
jgi:hypothetical protein